MQLAIENIRKSFGSGDSKNEVLKGISCTIESGSICVLLGPSGSGKSTLLNIIGGIETADEGTIHIGDEVLLISHPRKKEFTEQFMDYVLGKGGEK